MILTPNKRAKEVNTNQAIVFSNIQKLAAWSIPNHSHNVEELKGNIVTNIKGGRYDGEVQRLPPCMHTDYYSTTVKKLKFSSLNYGPIPSIPVEATHENALGNCKKFNDCQF